MSSFTRHKSNSAADTTAHATPPRDLRKLRSGLVCVAAARQTQLLNLRPIDPGNVVATEYRASVRRIYNDIQVALDRKDAGTYGECARCGTRMPIERLLDKPWTARCEPCAAGSS